MTNNWLTIWNKRTLGRDETPDLDALIRLDGFDVGAGYVTAQDWRTSVARVSDLLHIQDGDSVFEFGCGSGAFLYALIEQRVISEVGGADYSAPLIEVARRSLPDNDFFCTEAKDVPCKPQYDHCITHGMFHYFDTAYAELVLKRMLCKARHTVAILEVPDAASREASERIRRDRLTPEEYNRKYAGLPHNYYEREWFEKQAVKLGLNCEFIENQIPNYAQKDFRFGCIMRKS